jgi:hypothetical protein
MPLSEQLITYTQGPRGFGKCLVEGDKSCADASACREVQ